MEFAAVAAGGWSWEDSLKKCWERFGGAVRRGEGSGGKPYG